MIQNLSSKLDKHFRLFIVFPNSKKGGFQYPPKYNPSFIVVVANFQVLCVHRVSTHAGDSRILAGHALRSFGFTCPLRLTKA